MAVCYAIRGFTYIIASSIEFLFFEPVYRTDYAAQIEGAIVEGISFTSACKDKYEFVNEGDKGLVHHVV